MYSLYKCTIHLTGVIRVIIKRYENGTMQRNKTYMVPLFFALNKADILFYAELLTYVD